MAEYYIAPKSSFDATADAIREKTGSQAAIEWMEDGFADAIEDIPSGGYSMENVITHDYGSVAVTTVASKIYASAFEGTSITSISAPNILTISDAYDRAIFKGCTSLTTISFPNLTAIRNYCAEIWRGCTSLTEVSLPKLEVVGTYADDIFRECTGLVTIAMPLLSELGSNEFRGCTSLVSVALPSLHSMFADCFNGCTLLTSFDMLGESNNVGLRSNNFYGCTNFNVLVIRETDGVCKLQNINNFNNTPFASGKSGGTLYVPSSLVSQYTQATNWSTILAYTNNQIKSIESTHTDPNATIDLTLYYVDGAPIPTT